MTLKLAMWSAWLTFVSAFLPSNSDDIEQVGLIDGSELKDYALLYEVDSTDSTGQLVIHFKSEASSRRSKRERSDDEDSDEEELVSEDAHRDIPAIQCSRCGKAIETKTEGCFYHPGGYLEVASNEYTLRFKNDVTEIAGDEEIPEMTELKTAKRYSCCGEYDRFSRGCMETSHIPSHSTKAPLDQKLISFFTSSASLEPPTVDPKQVAQQVNQAAAPVAAGDDDEVQIIGRDRLLGNANANGTVNLAPIAVPAKTFALNESLHHTFGAALGISAGSHLESDCDAELILATGWTTLVRPQTITIAAHTDLLQAPSNVKIFINKQAQINFDNCNDLKPDQEFTLTEDSYVNGVASLQLTARLYTKVSTLTLYITGNLGDQPTTTIRRIAFIGMAPNVR